MRILVDLPERELEQLTALSRSRKTSRSDLIRQAVAWYLALNRAGIEDSFGLWESRGADGLEYQNRLRDEWER